MFNIVLLEPEIPANTGNIGRTCLVTGSRLHLIEPLGFLLNDKYLKRAGMDYWKDLDVTVYDSWRDFVDKNRDHVAIFGAAYGAEPELHMEIEKPVRKSTYEQTKEQAGIPKNGSTGSPDGNTGSPDRSTGSPDGSTGSPDRICKNNLTENSPLFTENCQKAKLWMATTKAKKTYDAAGFQDGDYILFGKESAGIPEEILMDNEETCVRIPMASGQRSLNLSNSVAVVLYEALRQNRFPDLETKGQLHHHKW